MRPPNWTSQVLEPYALAEVDRASIVAHIDGLITDCAPVVLFVRGMNDNVTVFATVKKACIFSRPSFDPPMMLLPLEGYDDMVIMNQPIAVFLAGLYTPDEELA